jgi:hypothetical protein
MLPVSFLIIERGYDVRKRNGVFLLLFVAVAFGLAQHPFFRPEPTQKTTSDFQQIPLTFRSAPDFSLPSLRGPRISLSDYHGSVVLLEFWASW